MGGELYETRSRISAIKDASKERLAAHRTLTRTVTPAYSEIPVFADGCENTLFTDTLESNWKLSADVRGRDSRAAGYVPSSNSIRINGGIAYIRDLVVPLRSHTQKTGDLY